MLKLLKAIVAILALGGFTLLIFRDSIPVNKWLAFPMLIVGILGLMVIKIYKSFGKKDNFSLNQ